MFPNLIINRNFKKQPEEKDSLCRVTKRIITDFLSEIMQTNYMPSIILDLRSKCIRNQ